MTERVVGRLAAIAAAFALVVTLAPLQPAAAQTPTTPPTTAGRYFADSALQRIWERNDRPVEQLQTTRSWTWGPNSTFNGLEPFKQGPNGRRLVQYFDKARMEINNPNADRDEFNFVTNGLLVREMVGGKIAVGDKPEEYEAKEPSGEAVAGDPANVNDIAPTYASFREVASLAANERPAENRVGLKVRQLIDKKSRVRDLPAEQQALADLVKIQVFDQNLKHNIPDKFWAFLTQTGAVYEGGRTVPSGSVFQPWEFVMGLPVTEPYWMQTKVAGIERYVLVQLYERRVLTYTPSNRPGFEVEMGNAGQHYYRWRYDLTDGGRTEEGARPKLDNLERTALTTTTARIEWTTDKPTTSRMEYGLTQDFGSLAGQNTEYILTHNVLLERLTPNTVYYYRVISRDREGLIVDDEVHSFKTLAS